MRTTLVVKRIDLFTQIAVAVIPLLYGAFYDKDYLLLTYFILGGAQLISCIMNRIFLDKFLRDDTRIGCEWVVVILLLLLLACLALPSLIYAYLFGLLFFSPFLALWYMIICYNEMRKIYQYVDREQYVKL